MKTYFINTDWSSFENYIHEHIRNCNQVYIGIIHHNNEIFIRTISDNILNIVQSKYKLTPGKEPDICDKTKNWQYLGNPLWFDLRKINHSSLAGNDRFSNMDLEHQMHL